MSPLEDRDVERIGSLADPVRRALYRYVADRGEPVTRDEAAQALDIPRHRAKFHLDRLAADGLLTAGYARTGGRGGPGAGRPAKRYRRSDGEVSVTLPERDYARAGHLLAAAVSAAVEEGRAVDETLHEVAARRGAELAGRVRAAGPDAAGAEEVAVRTLADEGYEPRREGDRVVLANCPFHALARDHTALVCGMNLSLLGAFCEGLADGELVARLEPAPGRCCVTLCRPSS
jgi:predicted ArsR family transcriptional regulator